jgi:hypothetical protein
MSKRTLPCAIYGHNYMKTKTNLDHSVELTCTQCDIEVLTDPEGNFDTNTVTNSQIKDTLEELYRLSRRVINAKAS